MTHFLFNSSDADRQLMFRQGDFGRLLIDLSRASTDALDALPLFENLVIGGHDAEESQGFLTFDAHCGDTGCHIRATMTQELFIFARPHLAIFTKNLSSTREQLASTREKLRSTCKKLTGDRMIPKSLGLAKRESTRDMLKKHGWIEDSLMWENTPSTDSTVTTEGGTASLLLSSGDSPRSWSTTSSRNSSIGLLSDEEEDVQDWPLLTSWSTNDSQAVLRYLVYAFVLSKYKTFPRSELGCVGQLEPNLAFDEGNSLIEPYFDFDFKGYSVGSQRRIESEFKQLQRWLTDMSCAWLETSPDPGKVDLGEIVRKTVDMSPKGLKVTACYPGYLVLRQLWAENAEKILIVDRYFCRSGHHDNMFQARLSSNEDQTMNQNCEPRWLWTRVSGHSTEGNFDDRPLVCIIANSTEGPQEQVNHRALQEPIVHECECAENESHVAQLILADHDRMFLAIFAAHSQYPFESPLCESSENVLRTKLKDHETVEVAFRRSRAEAQDLNISRLLSIEHVFLESEKKLKLGFKLWADHGKTLPLHNWMDR